MIATAITFLTSRIGAWVAAAAAAVGFVLAIFMSGRRSATDSIARQTAEAKVEQAQERANVEVEVARTAAPLDELRAKWRRP